MTISKDGLWDTVKGQRQRWLKDKSGNQSEDMSSIELQKVAENWERPVPEVQKLSTHETLRGTTYSEKVQRNLYESDLRGHGWTEIQALIDALPETRIDYRGRRALSPKTRPAGRTSGKRDP